MKRLFLFAAGLLFGSIAFGQIPNCQINFDYVDVATSPAFDNRTQSCAYWVLTYQTTFAANSLQFESATGSATPGAFAAFTGTVNSGVNPSTSVACSTVTNCTATFIGNVGWYRVNFLSHTGNGEIRGTLQGYKTGYPLGGNTTVGPGGSGCVGTIATPCVVVGPVAAGAAVAGSPIQVAGTDGANVRRISTDTSGRTVEVGAAAAGAAVAGSPVRVGGSDGANTQDLSVDTSGRPKIVGAAANGAAVVGLPVLTAVWDGTNVRTPVFCPLQASIATSATAVIVAGVAAKKTYICQVMLSNAAAVDITLKSGTGVTCGTGTTSLTGAFRQVLTAILPFQSYAPLVTAAAADDLCVTLGAAIDIEGVILYAQF